MEFLGVILVEIFYLFFKAHVHVENANVLRAVPATADVTVLRFKKDNFNFLT